MWSRSDRYNSINLSDLKLSHTPENYVHIKLNSMSNEVAKMRAAK